MNRAMQCYLKARELHLMFTPEANARARALFEEAINLDGTFHRAKGHLVYSSIQAWLYGWSAINLTQVRNLAWNTVYSSRYPKTTEHDGAGDYDNWWSVGVALLYYAAHSHLARSKRKQVFEDSIRHYQQARTKAWPDENDPKAMVAVKEDMADLLADYAEALYFRGNKNDVREALALLDKAKRLGAGHHPKWHDWNRAWAHYELGNELARRAPAESKAAYLSAIGLLKRLPTLPNQYRRTLAACYAALGQRADAHRVVEQFLMHERSRRRAYDPVIENRWPYRDRVRLERLKRLLKTAGLPTH